MTRSPRVGALRVLGGVIVCYLAFPLVAFVLRLVTSPRRGFHRPGLYAALGLSIEGATIALVLITLFGVPLAYVLARSTTRVAKVVGGLVQLPLALPPLMSGVLLIYVVGPYTTIGRLFHRHLTESIFGVVLAMSFVSAPFLIVAARAAFRGIDRGLFDVATTLGHGEFSTFWRVALPGARDGVRAGMVLAWLRAFGEYGAIILLAYNPTTLPVFTYNQFSASGLSSTLAPTALALVVALGVVSVSRLEWPSRSRASTLVDVPTSPSLAARDPRALALSVDQWRGSFHLRVRYAARGTRLSVLGASGAGKSMLLRSLAGLEGPTANRLRWRDEGDDLASPPRVGYVAQGFSLFPHLRVSDQLLFARAATPALAAYWRSRLALEGLERRFPHELSGGQRQRVALAQALCAAPDVLLLDEPFSALDAPVRQELRRELRRLQRETGLATVLVTHDPEEAAFLADDVIVLGRGEALQSGPSRTLFTRPASAEVAQLLGVDNVLRATVHATTLLDVAGQLLAVDPLAWPPGTEVACSVRPEDVVVTRVSDDALVPGTLRGTLRDVVDVATAVDLFVELDGGGEVHARQRGETSLVEGERCVVSFAPAALTTWANLSSSATFERNVR
ncbi:MAG: ATP-binding cassette domain-containing protein [Acidobacteriota bacterium]|nr:ATP-binding cassette domain-containing protein [Acidobacteriota bacterium]MDE3043259.1 ATP-binding cassette domain-containing protein [Acidobacteriota bacterium]MDE3106581.1 ATP-binding cassette domain-containing protein [Acidobacteriota bacterium]MDE3222182.1 ATP-binding cassette domain-containing protein [Acidobacteriota bacterium]